MKTGEIIDIIEKFAPPHLAEGWDNVGLIAGDDSVETSAVVLCLDITEKAYDMCIESGAKICISHHPYLFEPFLKMDFSDPYFSLIRKFIKSDIAIYAAHTNLDACVGGVNDSLCKKLDIIPIRTFIFDERESDDGEHDGKTVIVNGMGRIGTPRLKTDLFQFYKKLVSSLNILGAHVNFDTNREIKRVLVTGGSYSSDWNSDVLENGIDLVVSGEIKHKDMMFFQRHDIAAIAAGHEATERIVLPDLAEYLNSQMPQIKFAVCDNLDYNKIVF